MKKTVKKAPAKVTKVQPKPGKGSILFRRYDNNVVFTFFVASAAVFAFSILYSVDRFTENQLMAMQPVVTANTRKVLGATTKAAVVNTPEKEACTDLKKQLCTYKTSEGCKDITTVCTKLGY